MKHNLLVSSFLRPTKCRLEDMPRDLSFRVAYVPYVIANIAWDYADSIRLQAAQLKLRSVAKLSRAIRDLFDDYEAFRKSIIFATYRQREAEHAEIFQDGYSDYFSKLYRDLSEQVQYTYPRLRADNVAFLATVYMTIVVLQALIRYWQWADDTIEQYTGIGGEPSLPRQVKQLNKLVWEYLGVCDKAVKLADLQPSIERLTDYIHNLELSDDIEAV